MTLARSVLAALVAGGVLAAVFEALAPVSTSVATSATDLLRLVAGVLFVSGAVFRLSGPSRDRDPRQRPLALGLLMLGMLYLPIAALATRFTSGHLASVLEPSARLVISAAVFSLLLTATRRQPMPRPRALARTLALPTLATLAAVAAALLWKPGLASLSTPHFALVVGLAVSVGWFVVGLALNARSELLSWAGPTASAVACLSVAAMFRGVSALGQAEWAVSGAGLTAFAAASISYRAFADLGRASRDQYYRQLESHARVVGLTQHGWWLRPVQPESVPRAWGTPRPGAVPAPREHSWSDRPVAASA